MTELDRGRHPANGLLFLSSAGNYQFKVMAANSDGVWTEKAADISLEVNTFTKQIYLRNLFSSGGGSALIIWKISVFQIQSRERKLARLINEKTDELKKANDELQHLANSDGLTKVGNRRFFEEFLISEWSRAQRSGSEISLMRLDIDYFKLFNDTYGHQAGDNCLQQLAVALKESTRRPTDFVARFGGEEFAVILGETDLLGAENIANQILDNVRKLEIPHSGSKNFDTVTVSIGVVTTFVGTQMSEIDLIKAADQALYEAKESGRNCVVSKDLTFEFCEFPG